MVRYTATSAPGGWKSVISAGICPARQGRTVRASQLSVAGASYLLALLQSIGGNMGLSKPMSEAFLGRDSHPGLSIIAGAGGLSDPPYGVGKTGSPAKRRIRTPTLARAGATDREFKSATAVVAALERRECRRTPRPCGGLSGRHKPAAAAIVTAQCGRPFMEEIRRIGASRMVKDGSSPLDGAWSRKRRLPTE